MSTDQTEGSFNIPEICKCFDLYCQYPFCLILVCVNVSCFDYALTGHIQS